MSTGAAVATGAAVGVGGVLAYQNAGAIGEIGPERGGRQRRGDQGHAHHDELGRRRARRVEELRQDRGEEQQTFRV